MTAPTFTIVERRAINEQLRVLVAVDDGDELAVAYGHGGYWHIDIRPAALAHARMPLGSVLHGFWAATETEARTWLEFISRLCLGGGA